MVSTADLSQRIAALAREVSAVTEEEEQQACPSGIDYDDGSKPQACATAGQRGTEPLRTHCTEKSAFCSAGTVSAAMAATPALEQRPPPANASAQQQAAVLHAYELKLRAAEAILEQMLLLDFRPCYQQAEGRRAGAAGSSASPTGQLPAAAAGARQGQQCSPPFVASIRVPVQIAQEARRRMQQALTQTDVATHATVVANEQSALRSGGSTPEQRSTGGTTTPASSHHGSRRSTDRLCLSGRSGLNGSPSPGGTAARTTVRMPPLTPFATAAAASCSGSTSPAASSAAPAARGSPLCKAASRSPSKHQAGSPVPPRSPLSIPAAPALSELPINSPAALNHRRSGSVGDLDKVPSLTSLERFPSFSFATAPPSNSGASNGGRSPAQENSLTPGKQAARKPLAASPASSGKAAGTVAMTSSAAGSPRSLEKRGRAGGSR